MLERKQVLFLLVSRASYEPHPAWGFFVTAVQEIVKFVVSIYLQKGAEFNVYYLISLVSFFLPIYGQNRREKLINLQKRMRLIFSQ